MDTQIYVEKVNESQIRCYFEDEGVARHVYEFFQYQDKTFQPNPYSRWDGMVRLMDLNTGLMGQGLLQVLLVFCKQQGYTIGIDDRLKTVNNITQEDLDDWVKELDLTVPGENYKSDKSDYICIDPYFYQSDALYYCAKFNKFTILAATGAGKSLIAYLLIRYYEMVYGDDGGKILLVVPSAKLVRQMKADFEAYSIKNGWDADANCHQIVEGAVKTSNKPVFISTWQAIQDEHPSYFDQFTKLIVDECHGSGADKMSYICKHATRAHQRVGMTATLKDTEMHQLQVQANFGPIKRVVSTKQLQDMGQAADTMIHVCNLSYSAEDRLFASTKLKDYHDEIDWLINHPYRNKIIKSMILSLKGNSLFLFNRNEAHLEVIYNEIKELKDHVYMINGEVKLDDRAEIERIMESGENVTILASYGTMSTGISIKKMHNLVLCHPSKSLVRVLQSIGRMLRMHSSKNQAQIYDLVDVLSLSAQQYKNYAMKHAVERFGFYTREQHKTKMRPIEVAESFLTWVKPKPKGKKKVKKETEKVS